MPPTSAGPGRGPEQAAQHADGRGLAGAVAAEEPEDLAGADVERHVVDGDEARRIGASGAGLRSRSSPDRSGEARFGQADARERACPIELRLQERVLGVEHFDLRDDAGLVPLAPPRVGLRWPRAPRRRRQPPRRGRTRSRARAGAPRPRARSRTRQAAAVRPRCRRPPAPRRPPCGRRPTATSGR